MTDLRRHSSRGSQFQKRKHFIFHLPRAEPEKVIQRNSLADVELPGADAAQRVQVRSAAKLLAEVVGNRANISAFGACQAETGHGFGVGTETKVVNVYEAG